MFEVGSIAPLGVGGKLETVARKGGNVQYHDPYIPTVQTHYYALTIMRLLMAKKTLHSIEHTAEALATADVVVLTTNHSAFDLEFIQKHAKMIVDMRNIIKESGEKVYKL